MSKTIATENAPAAIGPYVQGVDLGSMIDHLWPDPGRPENRQRPGRRVRAGAPVAEQRESDR